MHVSEFDFSLPPELIAQHPLPDRAASRMMRLDRASGAFADMAFRDLPALLRPDDLLAHVIRVLLQRNPGIDPEAIEDVIAGDANQAGEDNRNVARMAALLAGLPVTVAGTTVNRLCASGLQALMDASRAIFCGDGDIYIAAGVESMTRAPFVTGKSSHAYSRQNVVFVEGVGDLLVLGNRAGVVVAVQSNAPDFDQAAVDAIQADWSRLVHEMQLAGDSQYIRHRGGPVVGFWGYDMEEASVARVAPSRPAMLRLVEKIKNGR